MEKQSWVVSTCSERFVAANIWENDTKTQAEELVT